mmetsp:Transcript_75345/g.201295  ORF Transcript_75345/g.201295 Transcript_75345/m.201295 type:complete len:237 (-) Transcript_75345:590-1300(-)
MLQSGILLDNEVDGTAAAVVSVACTFDQWSQSSIVVTPQVSAVRTLRTRAVPEIIRAVRFVLVGIWVQWSAFGTIGMSLAGGVWVVAVLVAAQLQHDLIESIAVDHQNSCVSLIDVLQRCILTGVTISGALDRCPQSVPLLCPRLAAETRRAEQVLCSAQSAQERDSQRSSALLSQLCTVYRAIQEMPSFCASEPLVRSLREDISGLADFAAAQGTHCSLSMRNSVLVASSWHTSS